MEPDAIHCSSLRTATVLVPAGRETKKLPFGESCRPASHFRLGRCCRVCRPSGAGIVKRFVNSSLVRRYPGLGDRQSPRYSATYF